MEPLNARSMLDAATSAAAKPADQPFVERRRRLSPAALDVVNQKVARAYSPIVITGFVRLADFALLSLVGIALYVGYVMPLAGSFSWVYPAQIIAVAVAAVVCFQAADIYQVQLFRGQLRHQIPGGVPRAFPAPRRRRFELQRASICRARHAAR